MDTRRKALAMLLTTIIAVAVGATVYVVRTENSSFNVVKPSIGPIQPAAGYYLPFEGNTSKIFVVSVNISAGSYPDDTFRTPNMAL